MSSYILRITPFFWVIMQGKPKVEETAPGVATGMILSLRERYHKIWNDFYCLFMLSVVRLHQIMFKPNIYFSLKFSFAVFRPVRITLQHVKYVFISINWCYIFVPILYTSQFGCCKLCAQWWYKFQGKDYYHSHQWGNFV